MYCRKKISILRVWSSSVTTYSVALVAVKRSVDRSIAQICRASIAGSGDDGVVLVSVRASDHDMVVHAVLTVMEYQLSATFCPWS